MTRSENADILARAPSRRRRHGTTCAPACALFLAVVVVPTALVAPAAVVEKLGWGTVLANGETLEVAGVQIEAVPMYNLKRGPEEGSLYHEKGRGNGYVLTGGFRYIIGWNGRRICKRFIVMPGKLFYNRNSFGCHMKFIMLR